MPFAMHTDVRFVGDLIGINKGAYGFVFEQKPFLYPPLAAFTAVLFQQILRPLIAPFFQWPYLGAEARILVLSQPYLFRVLFAFKSFHLVFDFLILYFLAWMFYIESDRIRNILLFWLFNPIVIYNTYLHGQIDLMPLFFIVLGLYFAKRGRAAWAIFWLGIGACYKPFPLFFLPPAILILDKTWRGRLKLSLLGFGPFILSMLPYMGRYTRSISNYPQLFFKLGYDLGFGAQVYIFFVLYAVLLWYIEHNKAHTFAELWRYCFIILLFYYPMSYFDLHYYAWIIPFAAFYLAEQPQVWPIYTFAFLGLLACLTPTPLARYFAPISSEYFLRLPSLLEALTPYLPVLFIVNVLRSFLVGTFLWLAWRIFQGLRTMRPVAEG